MVCYDTSNVFVITITSDGDPITLDQTLNKVVAVFRGSDMKVHVQDEDSGLSFDGNGIVTINVLPTSFCTGTNTIELQIFERESASDEEYSSRITTCKGRFSARADTTRSLNGIEPN